MSFETTQDDLETLFAPIGTIVEIVLPVDRMTARPRGFAFVEFADAERARDAIDQLDGVELGGRSLRVSEAVGRGSSSPGDSFAPPRSPDRPRKTSRPKGSRRGVRGRKRGF